MNAPIHAPLPLEPALATAGWVWMWSAALVIYGAAKLASWLKAPGNLRSRRRSLGYLLAWPGMDASSFLATAEQPPVWTGRELATAGLWFALGTAMFTAAALSLEGTPYLRGWIAMIGFVLLAHFGLFGLLSVAWRAHGVEAPPLMDRPLRSPSVAGFWGGRWNRAFSDLLRQFWFRSRARKSPVPTLLIAFGVSGLVHELVITLPAGGGYGGPTAYFLLQGLAILLERSRRGRRLGLRRGLRGWSFTALIVALPVPFLLFQPVFVHEVVLPFLDFVKGALP